MGAMAAAAEAEAAEKEDAEVKEEGKEEKLLFEPAASYQGTRPGYVFKMGARGLGYYRDRVQEEKVKEEKKEEKTEKTEKVEKTEKTEKSESTVIKDEVVKVCTE